MALGSCQFRFLQKPKGQSWRELDHADSCQGVLFQPSQASTPKADRPGGSLLWLACHLCRSLRMARGGGAWSLPYIPGG